MNFVELIKKLYHITHMLGYLPAIIPARGGSKGVLRKNLRKVGGKPLLAWTIEDALESSAVTDVYVSTEDPEIAETARSHGAKVIDRPLELAGDTADSESALLHALEKIEAKKGSAERVVFLQATCPVRSGADIDLALNLFDQEQGDSLLSVSPSHVFLWTEKNGLAVPVGHDPAVRLRRQDITTQFRENGSLYIFKPSVLRKYNSRIGGKVLLFKMREEAGLDIDTEDDLERAAHLLRA